MQFFLYLIFLLSIYFIAIIPFWFLYQFSNVLAFLFYYVFQYRKQVILTNLRNSFPGMADQEIRRIARRTYRNLTDILVESIKGFTLSEQQIKKRFTIINPEILNEYFDQGKSVIGVTGHYGNWEWGAIAGSMQIKHKAIALYKPLTNKYIDRFLKRIRAENGTLLKSIYKTTETFKKFKDQPCIFILVADQSPSSVRKAYWVDFLNQDTACLHGPEKHARKNNYPVLFLKIQRIKRGYYQLTAKKLIEVPANIPEGEITQRYMQELEKTIREQPENWLWSHKRWKRKRSQSQ
ncbi:MAG: lysophospholipid acyltransferase family protein [Bacteroidales bacterium]|jgi:KDO2-lipid IV(A) lauroyltransferase|nr:lysophospholipid acyltransferase family protein [Bacteroidales bacterium]